MGGDEITEALLENHYYSAFRNALEQVFGRRVLRILKPSQRREVFLGFDQGFARGHGDVAVGRLLSDLQTAIAQGMTSSPSLWFGYFMQYKRVEEIRRKSKNMPPGFRIPYYRVPLSLDRKKETGRSQHETLVRLSKISGADTVYACPMLFAEEELHDDADIDDVRLVPVNGAPPGYLSNQRHYIAFSSRIDSNPYWCSEPKGGEGLSVTQWLAPHRDSLKRPDEFLQFLRNLAFEVRGRSEYLYAPDRTRQPCSAIYSPYLRIVEMGP